MGIEKLLDIDVLKASAIVSSVYISILIAGFPFSRKSEIVGKQAAGFITLFFIALFVYFVV